MYPQVIAGYPCAGTELAWKKDTTTKRNSIWL